MTGKLALPSLIALCSIALNRPTLGSLAVTDFSEDLWGSLVEYLTVYAKDDLRFMLPCEVEITA